MTRDEWAETVAHWIRCQANAHTFCPILPGSELDVRPGSPISPRTGKSPTVYQDLIADVVKKALL